MHLKKEEEDSREGEREEGGREGGRRERGREGGREEGGKEKMNMTKKGDAREKMVCEAVQSQQSIC